MSLNIFICLYIYFSDYKQFFWTCRSQVFSQIWRLENCTRFELVENATPRGHQNPPSCSLSPRTQTNIVPETSCFKKYGRVITIIVFKTYLCVNFSRNVEMRRLPYLRLSIASWLSAWSLPFLPGMNLGSLQSHNGRRFLTQSSHECLLPRNSKCTAEFSKSSREKMCLKLRERSFRVTFKRCTMGKLFVNPSTDFNRKNKFLPETN